MSISYRPSIWHWMLPFPPTPARHCQKPHTLLLTGEEEVGLSNPSSPSIAIGTASTTDRKNSAGIKGCLTTENHRRLLAEGQDQGRAYGHALHFFSLTNEKKKKIPYLTPRCPHTMNF